MKTEGVRSSRRSEKNLDWLKILLPVVETGVMLYLGGKTVQKTAHHAKTVAVRTAVLVASFVAFVAFFVAAVILVFVDLGYQYEMVDKLFLSGPIRSSIDLAVFGLLQFGVVYGIVKILEKRAEKKASVKKAVESHHPQDPLIFLGEEFLRGLITHLGPTKEEMALARKEEPLRRPTQHH